MYDDNRVIVIKVTKYGSMSYSIIYLLIICCNGKRQVIERCVKPIMIMTSMEGYLLPSDKDIRNHLCVLPCGGFSNNINYQWTTADLKYYVSYYLNGEPIDTMFNGFIFNGISVRNGYYIHPMYVGFGKPANRRDWIKWIDSLFTSGKNLDALYSLATRSSLDVWISIPYPYLNQQSFGKVNKKSVNFANAEDRFLAVSRWIDMFIEQWDKKSYLSDKLNLRGFLWQRESILDYDEQLVKLTNDYVKSKGFYRMWLPYYGSSGCIKLKELDFDIVSMHPNYYGNTGYKVDWINNACAFAKCSHTGLQIIYGKGTIYDNTHLDDYLNLGLPEHNKYMTNSFLVYQFPNQTLKEIYQNNIVDYIRLYTYIKGLYSKELYPLNCAK